MAQRDDIVMERYDSVMARYGSVLAQRYTVLAQRYECHGTTLRQSWHSATTQFWPICQGLTSTTTHEGRRAVGQNSDVINGSEITEH
jgi:hypothetical protein